MLSPQLRQRIFSLWTSFWSSGMTNPITAIEQITYLLFLQRLEKLDGDKVAQGKNSIYSPDHENCRWSRIRAMEDPSQVHDTLSQTVFPWLRGLGNIINNAWGTNNGSVTHVAEYLADAYFQLPREKTSTLQQALAAVDNLFAMVGKRSANADLMGDIFEYLLGELNTAGKNGQFRTPRHIIRFMIELLDPQPGAKVFDPAAGTGGFLTNTILHHWTKKTPPKQLRLEWDGTPHRLIDHDRLGADAEILFDGQYVTGFDIDRTMVRIGWMNLILHGVDNPQFLQTDPLSGSFDGKSNTYDFAFANPPYSGSVDRGDIHPTRFPRKDAKGRDPITDSTEMLFIWLMLDLLKPGGQLAVIVPEGLLFGTTGAHKALRRDLLFKHVVEGVISLPQGVFQPYTGVKTSILIVKKGPDETPREPRTKQVWFYEVKRDGWTMGTNRTAEPNEPNDLWDALEKWKRRNDPDVKDAEAKSYWQPDIHIERWRLIDETAIGIFPEIQVHEGEVCAIHELFPDLYSEQFLPLGQEKLGNAESVAVLALVQGHLRRLFLKAVAQQSFAKKPLFEPKDMTNAERDQTIKALRSLLLRESVGILERREGIGNVSEEHGRNLLNQAIETLRRQLSDESPWLSTLSNTIWAAVKQEPQSNSESIAAALKPLAQFDGYNMHLRSVEVTRRENGLIEPQCWTVPYRVWREQPDWTPLVTSDILPKRGGRGKATTPYQEQNADIKPIFVPPFVGSHDKGKIRPEYIAAATDPKTSEILPGFLDPNCIEANDLNLSAGRYRPALMAVAAQDIQTTVELIRGLISLEKDIQTGLEKLLDMLESGV